MKGVSKVIMGATLLMVVTLAIVLGLILVLLAELYCSLLRSRRQHKTNSYSNTDADSAAAATAAPHLPSTQQSQDHPTGPSLGRIVGILRAPRSFPSLPVSSKEEDTAGTKKQHSRFLQVFDIPVQNQEMLPNTSPCHIGIIMSIPSPSISFVTSPQPTPDDKISPSHGASCNEKAGGGSSGCGGGAAEHFVYISNPIYDNEAIGSASGTNTHFQTPDMSPSRMEMGGSSSSRDEEVEQPTPSCPSNPITTPPLTPMKKLPAEDCSVSLRDARSLSTSGSDSNSNNGLSSSSSGSPSTSPSW